MFRRCFVGLDVKDHEIALAVVSWKMGEPKLEQLATIEVSDEWLINGQADQVSIVRNELKNMRKQYKNVGKHTYLAVPTQHVLLRHMNHLPNVAEKELKKIIRFEIGNSIHLPFDEPIYEVVKLGSFDETSQLMLVATSGHVAEQLDRLARTSGFKPLSAEVRGIALQRLITFLHPEWLKQTEMVVDLGKHSVDLHIYHDGVIQFTRNISLAHSTTHIPSGENKEVAVTQEYNTGSHERVYEDAQRNQMEHSLLAEEILGYEEAYLLDLLAEIERAQSFYRYSFQQRDIEFTRLILTGELTENFVDRIQERVALHIERINFGQMKGASRRGYLDARLDRCSVAIGLALRGIKDKKATRAD